MSTYVIGDIQGCFLTMQKLLSIISFDQQKDRLILLGDVVNRGPSSLEVLRFIIANRDSISMVLGNHDILAIALFLGAVDRPHTMQALLASPEAPQIIDWLRHQPLMILRDERLFVHAGVLPSMSIEDALKQARLAEERLRGPHARTFLTQFYEGRSASYQKIDSLDPSIKALLSSTLIRMCTAEGVMVSYDGDLAHAPEGLFPWFTLQDRPELSIYFGHWAALGLYRYKNNFCLDSGCVWGNKLSALRLEDQKIFQAENCENSGAKPELA